MLNGLRYWPWEPRKSNDRSVHFLHNLDPCPAKASQKQHDARFCRLEFTLLTLMTCPNVLSVNQDAMT